MPESVDDQAVRMALDAVEWPQSNLSISDISEVEEGVNDVYTFSTGLENPKRAVCKFATFSEPNVFQAGAMAAKQIAAHTEIPVPEVYAVRASPTDLPAFQITEFVPGEPLPDHPDSDNPGPARVLGRVIRELGTIPSDKTDGYGQIQPAGLEQNEDFSHCELDLNGEYSTCSEWLLQYGLKHYDDLPSHDALASVAQAVPSYLRANSDRFPVDPPASIVLTDTRPENLLARDGTVSADGKLEELTGLIDLEYMTLGPMEFTAVNAEFLMQRWIDNPDPIIEALYEPLPFGPNLPRRDLYRLIAMGREVAGLDFFYDVGGEKHERRGTALADEIEQIVQ